jgi:hypothetical protein
MIALFPMQLAPGFDVRLSRKPTTTTSTMMRKAHRFWDIQANATSPPRPGPTASTSHGSSSLGADVECHGGARFLRTNLQMCLIFSNYGRGLFHDVQLHQLHVRDPANPANPASYRQILQRGRQRRRGSERRQDKARQDQTQHPDVCEIRAGSLVCWGCTKDQTQARQRGFCYSIQHMTPFGITN